MSGPVPVAFRTLGCKVNRVESDAIATELLGRGCRLADEDEAAVIIINTCTVTGEADAKARKAVRQALKASGEPVVVVTGCLAALDADGLRALGERVVVEADKEAVAARVAGMLASLLAPEEATAAGARTGEGFRTRVAVKVQDGCDNFCTYCIVPHARGGPRSRPVAEVLAEVASLVDAGVREVVLTGINIGGYRDEEAGGLSRLCVSLADHTGVERIRVSSIEAPGCGSDWVDAMLEAPQIVRHFHVPLQSGSDRILKAMGRHYTAERFETILAEWRERLPDITFTTDIITGFPGETDDDHAATMELCERIGFSRLHVFRYSARQGTPAASMPDQVPAGTKATRAEELRELDARLRGRFLESRLGLPVEVLVERIEDGIAEGTTREYLRLRFAAHGAVAGETVRVDLDRAMVR